MIMEEASSLEELCNIKENKVLLADEKVSLQKTRIIFKGKNNLLFLGPNTNLDTSLIEFNGSNSACYISGGRYRIYVSVSLNNCTSCYIGKNNYFNGRLSLSLSEQQNIIIGNDCLFSFGIWICTADPHLIYDIETGKRINPSKSVLIGDHVWTGQNAMILKGAVLGSGSVVGANSVVTSKCFPSNAIIGGNPARIIRKGIFFNGDCVHAYMDAETERSLFRKDPAAVFCVSEETMNSEEFFSSLIAAKQASKKLELLEALSRNTAHNRFAVACDTKREKDEGSFSRACFFDIPQSKKEY